MQFASIAERYWSAEAEQKTEPISCFCFGQVT